MAALMVAMKVGEWAVKKAATWVDVMVGEWAVEKAVKLAVKAAT
jgi:hypothetical protein